MGDAITTLVEGAMASPWVLLALFAFAAIDGFFPAVPSESLVVTAGVFAASTGAPSLPLVVLAAALGAFCGDHVSYAIGRRAGPRAQRRAGRAFGWASGVLADRGGTILLVCRYVPGARTAVTLTAGAVRYPLRSFTAFDAAAAASWGAYSALVGAVGGAAFEDEPLKGVVLGLGLALTVAAVVELVRAVRQRSSRVGSPNAANSPG